ncbi:MAG: hypothetical protein HC921_17980 [Synechococcaceae cyanobacterium SM2_3_1]|nr:hypothetical protein [Synechococcaceae cyanobacterium SM2_3_1]
MEKAERRSVEREGILEEDWEVKECSAPEMSVMERGSGREKQQGRSGAKVDLEVVRMDLDSGTQAKGLEMKAGEWRPMELPQGGLQQGAQWLPRIRFHILRSKSYKLLTPEQN